MGGAGEFLGFGEAGKLKIHRKELRAPENSPGRRKSDFLD